MSRTISLYKEHAEEDKVGISEEKRDLIDLIGEDLGRFSDQGVSLLNREIYLNDITQSTAIKFHKNLLALENISTEPIKIHIHSNGGLVDAGWSIYDAIGNSPCQIVGICWGICASMATVILQACDKRIITKHATFMMHEGSDTMIGEMKARDPIAYGLEAKRQLSLMYDILSSKTCMSKNQLEELISRTDLFLTPEEVIALALADAILIGKKKEVTKGKINLKAFNRILSHKSIKTIHGKGR